MAKPYSTLASFALLRKSKAVDVFYHSEPALRYFTLLGAGIVLSVVSFYTTYRGFEALTDGLQGAVALALAVQLTLFWTARELGRRGANWKEILIFVVSATLSVVFSYTFIADKISIQGSAGSGLMEQIEIALRDVDAAKSAVKEVAQRAEGSATRWTDMRVQEINLGTSTPKSRGRGKGGLADTYEDYAKRNMADSVATLAMLPKLDIAEKQLKAARAAFEMTKTFSEDNLNQLRVAIAAAKEAFKAEELAKVMGNIKLQENAIYDEFFREAEGTKRAKAFVRWADGKPIIPVNLFDNLQVRSLESKYNRATRNIRDLIKNPTIELVLAFVLATGLDFMILMCAFATNYGIPLRVIPNQEVDVDALLRAKAMDAAFPDLMRSLGQGGRKTRVKLDLENMMASERIPIMALIEKQKIVAKGDSFELAPDLVDYMLRAIYVEIVKSGVVSSMAGDQRVARLIPLASVRNGKLIIQADEAEAAGWEGIALLDLVERGLLHRKRSWRGKEYYVFTAEMIECCQRLWGQMTPQERKPEWVRKTGASFSGGEASPAL